MNPVLLPVALDATLPADLSGVVSDLFACVGSVVTTVKSEPIMLIGLAAVVGGIAISWFKRLTGQRSGKRK